MDRKTKVQMAWALLLGLLGLLAAGGLPSPNSPSNSPSTTPNTYANLDISEDEVRNHDEDETSETDPWVPPDDNEDNTGEGDGSPSPTGPGTGSGTGDEDSTSDGDDLPTSPLDDFPAEDDDGSDDGTPIDPIPDYVLDPIAPIEDLPGDGSSSDDSGGEGDGGTGTGGLIGDVDDLPGDGIGSGSLPAAFEDVTGDLANSFATTASVLALPAADLYDAARDPVTDMGHETVEYAQEHPGKAVLVGAGIVVGGAILVTASGWTVVGSGVSSSLAFVGVPRMQPQQARERFEEWSGINDDSSASPGETDNGTPLMGDGL